MGKVASAQLHHGNVQGDVYYSFSCFGSVPCCLPLQLRGSQAEGRGAPQFLVAALKWMRFR